MRGAEGENENNRFFERIFDTENDPDNTVCVRNYNNWSRTSKRRTAGKGLAYEFSMENHIKERKMPLRTAPF